MVRLKKILTGACRLSGIHVGNVRPGGFPFTEKLVLRALLILLVHTYLHARVTVISPGTTPTLAQAVAGLNAGDTLYLSEGHYHDTVDVPNLHGTEANPIVIAARPGDHVVIDGTVPISGPWTEYKPGIYKTTVDRDVWQLFVDGETQTSARWPNAFWHDETIWNQNYWAVGGKNNEKGFHSNIPTTRYDINLAESGLNMKDALVILNINNPRSYCQPVTRHAAGQGNFDYKVDTIREHLKDPPKPWYRYFFEGKLNLLDAPTEWFFDKDTREIYLYPPEGKDISNIEVRGKVQTYTFDFKNSSHLKLQGLNFYGTTVNILNSEYNSIEDCNFKYPSYNKRMLGDIMMPEVTRIGNVELRPQLRPTNFTLRNSTFSHADGMGLVMQGRGNLIDNVLFHHIDYACICPSNDGREPLSGDNAGFDVYYNLDLVMRRVTMHTMGNSEGISGAHWLQEFPDEKVTIELCHVYNNGLAQVQDGAAVQLWQFNGSGKHVTLRNSWAHDTFKFGFRIDGFFEYDVHPENSTLHNNVSWDIYKEDMYMYENKYKTRFNAGMVVKGDHHKIYNNTLLDPKIPGSTYPDLAVRSITGGNKNSVISNNLAGSISARPHSIGTEQVNGTHSNNVFGLRDKVTVRDELVDPLNRDFRPRAGSRLIDKGAVIPGITEGYKGSAPDIGAYEFGDENYWIPGYQTAEASMPVPLDRGNVTRTVVDLMWLMGYKSVSSDIYFGTSNAAVAAAGKQSPEFKGNQANNIFRAPDFAPGVTYYWRIDAVHANGTVVTGTVWSVTQGSTVAIDKSGENPISNVEKFKIIQNNSRYPMLSFILNTKSEIRIELFNLKGKILNRQVKILVAGQYVLPIFGETRNQNNGQGIYFIKLGVGRDVFIRKVTLVW